MIKNQSLFNPIDIEATLTWYVRLFKLNTEGKSNWKMKMRELSTP
jgi:hypothetical protein